MIKIEFNKPVKLKIRKPDNNNDFVRRETFVSNVVAKAISHKNGIIIIKMNDFIENKLKAGHIIKSISKLSLTETRTRYIH